MAVNKARIAHRFAAAAGSYEQHADAQKQIHQHLLSLLLERGTAFGKILEIGCGTGLLTRLLAEHVRAEHWVANDLSAGCLETLRQRMPSEIRCRYLCGDAETLDFGSGYDVVVSASAVQWFEDKERFVRRCARMLDSDGLLLFNTFSENNLCEIKSLTGVGLDYPDAAQWRRWLGADFNVQELSEYTVCLNFADPLDVLKHLKLTGVTAAGSMVWTRQRLAAFRENYRARFAAADGGVSLTYRPLYISAVRK
ncbi:malonyl-ACP O-methyltransferase BioC [Neisseria sp.]|uniref:malonyl-ACP O-methyltransferase BioC n=1 Tax=Neisseria sp. TaxID=192066 RepID=UPI00359FF86E